MIECINVINAVPITLKVILNMGCIRVELLREIRKGWCKL